MSNSSLANFLWKNFHENCVAISSIDANRQAEVLQVDAQAQVEGRAKFKLIKIDN